MAFPTNETRTPDDEGRKGFPEALYEAAKMPLAQSFLEFDPKRHKLDRRGYRDAWFAALAALLSGLAVFAWYQRGEAIAQRD